MRESGILMHITSLPGPCGVGTMGKNAFAFVDFLKKAGQSCWQILPLTPTGFGDSPYQSCSAYAGNPYLIDLPMLVEEGLLKDAEITAIDWCSRSSKVDYSTLYNNRMRILRRAFSRFRDENGEFAKFRACNDRWLPDYADFMCQKDRFGGKAWYEWPEEVKTRGAGMFSGAQYNDIQFYCFVQYLFFKQWNALRDYAHENGITIIGDVPIYVPYDSVEVWKNPEYFQLDETLTPTAVAGCPPDAFSEDGQLWGNPLYNWDALAEDGYGWWLDRLAAAGRLYDVVRVDHFRGFEAYWSVPYGDATARNGRWIQGPGMDFIRAVKENLPHIRFIAEDLGFLTQEVLDMRDESGFPGMKVLGFAFDSRDPSSYLPYMYPRNSVCYTGTHDNMTTRQWFETASADAAAYAREYLRPARDESDVWAMIRAAMSSVSDLCVIPMQDVLDLGGEARMNFPGTLGEHNWSWRAGVEIFDPALAQRLYEMTKLYGRLNRNN